MGGGKIVSRFVADMTGDIVVSIVIGFQAEIAVKRYGKAVKLRLLRKGMVVVGGERRRCAGVGDAE